MGCRGRAKSPLRVIERRYVLLAFAMVSARNGVEEELERHAQLDRKGNGWTMPERKPGAGGMQREHAVGSLAKVAGITGIHLAHHANASPIP